MIVIMNSFSFPVASKTAQRLAERYEAGTLVDIHEISDRLHSRHVKEPSPAVLFDEVCNLVFSKKKHGKKNFVMSYIFDNPDTLKQLRVLLSHYDNEIYAFRLSFSPAVLPELLASIDNTADNPETSASTAYSQWLEKQEEGAHYSDMGYEIIADSTDPSDVANAIWDDVHEPIELVEYQEQWPEMFAHEKQCILRALNDRIIDVEHIGSTAIPEMTAKPVIDILLTVEHLQDARKCIQPLRELGYTFIDYPQNTDRLFFRKGKPRSYHLHIVEKGSDSEENHIHFRDALLSDATLKNEYLNLKLGAIQKYRHRRALYGERKTVLIQRALAKFRTKK
jgi:GrpB-like predicted nucleotidyltransferase (UPF0157 family)